MTLMACLGAAGLAFGGQADLADRAAQVYARATNQFAAAIFFKPAEATNAGPAWQLAPLILQEVPARQAAAASVGGPSGNSAFASDVPASSLIARHSTFPSAAGASNSAAASALRPPVVCYAADSLQFAGRAHARFSYQWFYSSASPPGERAALPRQGIRITLDAQGQPAVWEVLADTTRLRLIFVSQSLETAAAAEFGKPLPGRRYAIERGLGHAPDVIVPRVVDDGPAVMGPIVYLSEGTRNVSTLICRCMAAQVKQVMATRTFELIPLASATLNSFLPVAGAASSSPPVVWPSDYRVENRLDHCLRLPAGF